ncbi:MAG TPA: TonB-dependent receptor [Candidatus Acidoferrales bacterium]|nr:TonB-dependent receptor [Candidatus Acidoferrales bacterium]
MKFRLAVLAVAAVCISAVASAQRLDGTLRGTVQDPSGAVIQEANVIATNQVTGVKNTTKTTSTGEYVFPNLLSGTYTVDVAASGFADYSRKDVEVLPNQVVSADARMVIATVGTTVEVIAGSTTVSTTTSQLSSDFGTRAVSELPNPNSSGSPLNLALLAPNTTTQGAGVLGEGGSIGGARPRLNSFNIDGVDDNRIDITGHITEVIPEAVADFNLVTNMFSAEIGHSAGGQFNIITKSGTNDWHGSVWGFDTNRNFRARDNLEKGSGLSAPRRYDFNRAGLDVGGPLIKNRLFAYGAYQHTWQGLSSAAVEQVAPTAQGLTLLNGLAANNSVRSILSQFPTAPVADANPEVVNGVSIPLGFIQPAAPNFLNQDDFNVNVDLNAMRHQFHWRFLYDRQRSPNVNPDTPLAQFTGDIAADSRKVIFTDAWAISPRVVNDFRFSYSRFVQGFRVPANFANFPNVEIDTLGLNIGPEGNSPQSYTQNNYQFANNITIVRGAHAFKFGPEWRHWIAPTNFLPRERGEWDYKHLEQFVNDLVPTGLNGALRGAGTGVFSGNQDALYGYVQDDWKMVPNFTLNLGLRYEWISNPRDAQLQTLNSVSTLPGIFEFRKPRTDTNNVAPRFGFAWDPFNTGKTAVRGGFGISYDLTFQNLTILQLPPQFQVEQNPTITCSGLAGTPPSWCASRAGFLSGGGLLSTLVPPQTQAEARAATGSIIVDTVQPKVLTWTLSVQRELFRDGMLELRYLGTRANHLPVQARLNTLSAFSAGLTPLPTFFSASEVPATITGGLRRSDFENYDPLRFSDDGFLGFVTGFPPNGNSIYHSGAVDFNRRFARGLMVRTNYTWAHNIDDSTNELFSSRVNPRRPQDWFNLPSDRGRSTLDIRHKFALSWIYELPKLNGSNGLVQTVLNGWQLSGTYLAQSGQPISILSANDANADFDNAPDRAIFNPNGIGNTGTGVNFVCVGAGGATSIVATSAGCAGGGANVAGYVAKTSSATYVQAGLGALPTVGRNTFQTPGVNVWNMSLLKNTKLSERVGVQFRVDTLNTFNHRNLSLAQPSVFQSGAILGTVNNALSTTYANVNATQFLDATQFSGGSRLMQLGLKFFW